MHSSGV